MILVDAIEADGEPGALVRLEGEDVEPAVRRRLSVHQVGVADLLDGLRLLYEFPRRLVLLGMVPRSLELSVSLTRQVEANLEELVDWIVSEAEHLGFRFRPRRTHEVSTVDGRAAASVGLGV